MTSHAITHDNDISRRLRERTKRRIGLAMKRRAGRVNCVTVGFVAVTPTDETSENRCELEVSQCNRVPVEPEGEVAYASVDRASGNATRRIDLAIEADSPGGDRF